MNNIACDKVKVLYDSRHIFEIYLKLFNSIAKKYDCKFVHDSGEGRLMLIGDESLLSAIRKEIIDTFTIIFTQVNK